MFARCPVYHTSRRCWYPTSTKHPALLSFSILLSIVAPLQPIVLLSTPTQSQYPSSIPITPLNSTHLAEVSTSGLLGVDTLNRDERLVGARVTLSALVAEDATLCVKTEHGNVG